MFIVLIISSKSIWIQLSMGLTLNYIWWKALIRRIGQFWSPPLDSEISVFWHKAPHNKSVRHIKQTCSAVGLYISQRPHEIRCRWLTIRQSLAIQTPWSKGYWSHAPTYCKIKFPRVCFINTIVTSPCVRRKYHFHYLAAYSLFWRVESLIQVFQLFLVTIILFISSKNRT